MNVVMILLPLLNLVSKMVNRLHLRTPIVNTLENARTNKQTKKDQLKNKSRANSDLLLFAHESPTNAKIQHAFSPSSFMARGQAQLSMLLTANITLSLL